LLILIMLTMVRVMFARMKIDQCLRFYWMFAVPLALIDFIRVLIGFYW